MTNSGFLFEKGWVRSFLEKRPVDKDGNPIPWLTLSFLEFFAPRIKRELKILEFGSGFSTQFYAKKVDSLTSIESNEEWYNMSKANKDLKDVQLLFKQGAHYWECLDELAQRYDIIIVDGDERLKCAQQATKFLTEGGVIILDNSIRKDYIPIYDVLAENNFRHIDFNGVAPGSRKDNRTTVFYKADNCLGI
jgi:predicted O-methyltransferase YrrM